MASFISEDNIEQAIIQKLVKDYDYQTLNCYTTVPDDLNDGSHRTDKREVVLHDRLKAAAVRLNPGIPEDILDRALAELTQRRYAMSPALANREVDRLIREGIPVEYPNADGKTEHARVRVIDFNARERNEFLAVSQLWIRGEFRYRRPDVL
ncbi:MAG: deoxyribonuclease, partial [Anaerolineales bacterium]|nr:deoxyribonuclease [Anaerolineales bacterium]